MALYDYNLLSTTYNFNQETVSFSVHKHFIEMCVGILETMYREALGMLISFIKI